MTTNIIKHPVNYVAFKHIDLADGAGLIADMVKTFNQILGNKAEQPASVAPKKAPDAAAWSSTKKITANVHGEEVKLNHRLLRMAAADRLDACACCGLPIDGFFIGFELNKASQKSEIGESLRLIPTINGQFATCDHVIPQTLGGRDSVANMQTMCSRCNSSKGHEITDADLDLVRDNAFDCVNPNELYTAARGITREYRAAKNGWNSVKNKNTKSRMAKAEKNLVNLRKLIAFTASAGMSMKPLREAEVARNIANNQLVLS